MCVETCTTTTIANLFGFFRRLTLVLCQRIEALEHEATVIAQQFMQPKHSYKEDCIIVIALYSFTLAPWTPHAVHSSRVRLSLCAIMFSMKETNEQADADLDPVIEVYKKDVDVTLIRENLRLTVDQRFDQLMKLQQFAADLRRAGRKARGE